MLLWRRKKKGVPKRKKKKRRKKREESEKEAPKYDDRRLRKDILTYFSKTRDVWVSYTKLESRYKGIRKEMAIPVANRLEGEGYLETEMKKIIFTMRDSDGKIQEGEYAVRYYRLGKKRRERS